MKSAIKTLDFIFTLSVICSYFVKNNYYQNWQFI